MSAKSHIIILPRREENLIAIVRCDCRVDSNNEVMNKIVKAVTKWVENTTEGSQHWKLSSCDFNIADLSSVMLYSRDEAFRSLSPFLIEEGIYNLKIDIFGDADSPSNYTYDTVLVEGL